jgi:RHS repeat-associated protein
VEYLLSDHLGTPSVVASANGTALRSNSFTPYGAPETPELEGPGFTGHRHDLESELIDMRGRLYDPLIAKFMSPDPIISAAHLSASGFDPLGSPDA